MSQQDDRRTSDEIEHEIHQTRARLDETLHEIEERFSPQKLMNTTYDYLRHGGAENALTSIGRAIRENPLPVMVTGIGLGWLLLAQRNSHHDYGSDTAYQGGYPGSTMPSTRMPNGDDMPGSGSRETFSGAGTTTLGHDPAALGATTQHGDEAHGHGGGMTQKAQQMASSMKERAQHMGSQVRERAQHVSGQMRERTQHMGDRMHSQQGGQSMTHRAREAGSQASHFVQDHPLVAGALGVAVGAVLGSLFSPTRMENRHLGEIRNRAMHRAEEAGHEQLERAEEKIHETAERVKEEARSTQTSNASSSSRSSTSSTSGSPMSSSTTSGSPSSGSPMSGSTASGSASSGSSMSGSPSSGSPMSGSNTSGSSSNASSYVENPSSEERYAKAGATDSGNTQKPGSEAARKGGSNTPGSKPPNGGSSSPTKGR